MRQSWSLAWGDSSVCSRGRLLTYNPLAEALLRAQKTLFTVFFAIPKIPARLPSWTFGSFLAWLGLIPLGIGSMAFLLSSRGFVMVKFSRLKRRLLSTSGDILRKCNSTSRWIYDLGDYYTTSAASGFVTGKHIDLKELEEDLAKEKSFA